MKENARKQRVVGIFLHGGGYCHMSAHEKSKTSKIPRRLMKVSICKVTVLCCLSNLN